MNQLRNNKIILTLFYSVIYAIGLQFFIISSGIFSTGTSGIAQIIVQVFPQFTFGILYLILNIPGFFLAYFKIGKEFTYYTILNVLVVTVLTEVLTPITLTDNVLLNALFGGVIVGYGIGGLLKIGSSSGGLDIYGVWYFKKTGTDFKTFNLFVNILIILIGAQVYGTDIALLTLFSTYFKNIGIGQIFTSNEKLTVWIVGEDLSLVSLYIHSKLKHGTTHFDARGGYADEDKTVIMTILNKYEYQMLINDIYDIQPNIFINVTETYNVNGNYKEKRI